MKKETLVNIIMVTLVIVISVGSGIIVYKNLHDKEERERIVKEEQDRQDQIIKAMNLTEVIPPSDPNLLKNMGFLLFNGKMYETIGENFILMRSNVVLPEKIKVLKTGKVITVNNKEIYLKEQEMINLEGKIASYSGKINIVTPTTLTPGPKMKK